MYDVIPETSPKPNDCGPTCLKMLLAYCGIDVPLETLVAECDCKINGCTGKDINRVGRAHGLDITSWQMDADEVIRQDRPSIVWWKYCHFVVCCGTDEMGKVVICNPDMGRYRMTQDTFKCWYSGVAFFNGEPHDLPEPDPVPDDDPETADKADAYDILMGVSE